MISLTLPWPPSVNRYWRHPTKGALAGRHMVSAEGRKYRKEALKALEIQSWSKSEPDQRWRLIALAYPPDRRKRDLDNLSKGLQDALVAAGVLADDSQLDDIRWVRGEVVKGGEIYLILAKITAGQSEDEARRLRSEALG